MSKLQAKNTPGISEQKFAYLIGRINGLLVLNNEEPVLEGDIDGLIFSLKDVLGLNHWLIKHQIVADVKMKKSLMKISPARERNSAIIYIRESLVGRPTCEFGPLLLHEVLHLALDPIVEEHSLQLQYEVCNERMPEYQKRLVTVLEKTIERLTSSLSQLIIVAPSLKKDKRDTNDQEELENALQR